MKTKTKILIVIIFLLGLWIINEYNHNSNINPEIKNLENENIEKAIVTKVIDGDTFVVEGGKHVRLLGIDTDEKGYPCYAIAKKRLENLILNKEVYLEKDKEDKDQYGRYLRYIFIDNNGTKENINLKMVEEGLAVARFYYNEKYKEEIKNAEEYAIKNKIGCKWNKTE